MKPLRSFATPTITLNRYYRQSPRQIVYGPRGYRITRSPGLGGALPSVCHVVLRKPANFADVFPTVPTTLATIARMLPIGKKEASSHHLSTHSHGGA